MVKLRIFTFISFFLFCFLSPFCYGADSLSLGQSISGNQTITSAGDKFVLGFFNPGNSQNHYIGIWYNTVSVSVQTIVWVANRENPITNSSSGVLQIGSDGNLVILDGRNISLWSTNSSSSANSKPIARLLDSGNLVLIDDNSGGTLWQSFDYPTDTLLPGMKFGMDLKTGHRWSVVPWKRSDDPSPGGFIYELDPRGWPQFFVMNGLNRSWRTGPWNGRSLSGIPEMYPESISSYTFVNDNEEISFSFTMLNSSIISRFMVATDGTVQRFAWLDAGQRWLSYWLAPGDQCDIYGACGSFSFCTRSNSSFCSCLQGFEPKSSRDWLLRDWPGGCVRRTELGCGDGDGFLMLTEMELPDSSEAQVDKTLNLEECRVKCLSNCSCTAYANSDVRGGGSGCVIWVGDLIDLRQFSAGGQNLYLRLAASELGGTSEVKGSSRKKRMILEIGLAITLSGILLLVCCGYYMFKKRKFKGGDSLSDGRKFIVDESSSKKMDLPLFSFGIIEAATCNFSDTNKLGEGGFGPVYKGRLLDGQDIAVKRLAKCSTQGIDEFENEVMLIVKLQHRNLVRLLGFCTHGEERILVYEYLHNKSLDFFLFEKSKSMLLDWKKRLEIIVGIARGLLYLHEDSRLRIIHRDLKSSNILLDVNMNPKISDFGLARIFGGDQIQANTNKVAGTYGYMAPEYAMEGIFSVKSDVFSFGVLVLEILSGKKINNFYSDESSSLIGYAWKLWQEDKGIELLDLSMGDSYSTYEVLKCIHIGLLCVQESPGDRPNMSSVVNMLGSELTTLPPPKKPAFSTRTTVIEKDPSSVSLEPMSINSATITIVEPR